MEQLNQRILDNFSKKRSSKVITLDREETAKPRSTNYWHELKRLENIHVNFKYSFEDIL